MGSAVGQNVGHGSRIGPAIRRLRPRP
jgi:hypothetical protein